MRRNKTSITDKKNVFLFCILKKKKNEFILEITSVYGQILNFYLGNFKIYQHSKIELYQMKQKAENFK